MDNILYTFILMLVVFVGVYIFMSRKLDRTNLTDRLQSLKPASKAVSATKKELEKIRIKKDLMDIFPKLSEEERAQWLKELKQLSDDKNNAA